MKKGMHEMIGMMRRIKIDNFCDKLKKSIKYVPAVILGAVITGALLRQCSTESYEHRAYVLEMDLFVNPQTDSLQQHGDSSGTGLEDSVDIAIDTTLLRGLEQWFMRDEGEEIYGDSLRDSTGASEPAKGYPAESI